VKETDEGIRERVQVPHTIPIISISEPPMHVSSTAIRSPSHQLILPSFMCITGTIRSTFLSHSMLKTYKHRNQDSDQSHRHCCHSYVAVVLSDRSNGTMTGTCHDDEIKSITIIGFAHA
jgi:hypothetical protein